MDAGPSGQSESTAGHMVIDAAEGYELQNVHGSREQSAGSRATSESVTGNTAVNSAERAQADDVPSPDAADEGIKRSDAQILIWNSGSSSKSVAGAHANDGESMAQTARPGESNPAHQDDAAAQDNEAAAGSPRGPTGDSVIDIDGPQDSQSASANHHGDSMVPDIKSPHPTSEELQAYWYRLKRTVADVDWEKYLNPSEASLDDGNECLLFYKAGWKPCVSMKQLRQNCSACLGFNVGLASMLHLGAMFDIDPEFFRDDVMNRVRKGRVISSSESGIWLIWLVDATGSCTPSLPTWTRTPRSYHFIGPRVGGTTHARARRPSAYSDKGL